MLGVGVFEVGEESVSDFLVWAEPIQLVGTCANREAAVTAVRDHRPDAVLMDVRRSWRGSRPPAPSATSPRKALGSL